jgi:hypothetical protein
LLCTLVQSVVMNCWIQQIPLPPKYKNIRTYIPARINPNSIHAKLVDLLSRLIEFRDDLKNGLYSSPDAILQKALELDAALMMFVEEMPNHTSYKTCWISISQATEVQQLVYNRVFHGKCIQLCLDVC